MPEIAGDARVGALVSIDCGMHRPTIVGRREPG